jgi:hypothetical protein
MNGSTDRIGIVPIVKEMLLTCVHVSHSTLRALLALPVLLFVSFRCFSSPLSGSNYSPRKGVTC